MNVVRPIKVVMSGSGLLYFLYAGALRRLYEDGYRIEEVCGVSGGAVVAGLIASGYKPGDGLENALLSSLPGENGLLDWNWWPWGKWGILKGKKIERRMREFYVPSIGDAEIPCHIIATNVNDKCHVVFNSDTHADTSLSWAVRASISIPVLMQPIRDEAVFLVDGGVSANMPGDVFEGADNVIGLNAISNPSTDRDVRSLSDFLWNIVDILTGPVTEKHIEQSMFSRVLPLESSTPALNFHMSQSEARALIEEGYYLTDFWLAETDGID